MTKDLHPQRENQGWTRRSAMTGALGALAVLAVPGAAFAQAASTALSPRMRVIVDNDLAGDPDGLFQLAHALRSPSAQVRLIIGSHLHAGRDFVPDDGSQAAKAAERAQTLLKLMGLEGRVPVVRGAEGALGRTDRRASPEAVAAIIQEAMRADSKDPLYYVAGAGLTDLAAALQAEPRIAARMTLVWIGGSEHEGVAVPPGESPAEYNFTIDKAAVQYVFGQSAIPIWQVPRDAYRQMLVTMAELQQLARSGPLGAWLVGQIEAVRAQTAKMGMNIGETYILGDSPLVTLTALQASFQPDPASCHWRTVPTPRIDDDGRYLARADGRPMRVFDRIDTRLTFADMMAKLSA